MGYIIFRRDRVDDTDVSMISDRNSVEFDEDGVRNKSTDALAHSHIDYNRERHVAGDGRHHLKLPTFRPAHEALSDNDDTSDPSITSRQAREHRNTRSPRIDRLRATSRGSGTRLDSFFDAALGPVPGHEQDQINKQLARPGSVFPGAPRQPPLRMPKTGVAVPLVRRSTENDTGALLMVTMSMLFSAGN